MIGFGDKIMANQPTMWKVEADLTVRGISWLSLTGKNNQGRKRW
jgi:hypothetical protein